MTPKLRRPEFFYWPKHGFYTRNAFGEWMQTDKDTVRMILVRAGFRSERDGERLCPASGAMLDTMQKKAVHYAGPLAGHPTGMVDSCGFRVLVTAAARTIEPKHGKCDLWQNILEAHYGERLDYFLSWCKAAWERARLGGGPMLPALIIAGPPDLGKSLAQNHLITPLLGGRMAKPWRYWTGETNFNEDLCGAEHIMVEDEVCPVKAEKRRLLGDSLKNFVANETMSLHPKGDKALTVRCIQAITISTNLEPQNLRTLPLHDSSLNDKLLALLVRQRPACLPAADDYAGFMAFTGKLHAELPAFAAFLDRYQVPKECKGQRSLVAPWRDPEIMELVSEDDSVSKLIWLIDDLELVEMMPRTALAADFEKELFEKERRGEVSKLLAHVSLGHLLREASKRFPGRIEQAGKGHNNVTRWKILPAKKEAV